MHDTCGAGMAAHAALPSKLAEVMEATAALIDDHARWVGSSHDERALNEALLWASIAASHRNVADLSAALASQMQATRDLPDAPHDLASMGEDAGALMQRYVASARELAALLSEDADMMNSMLRTMQ